MKDKMKDLKGLVPYIQAELAKGRTRKSIFDELNLNPGQRSNLVYHLKGLEPPKDEMEDLTFIPTKMRVKKYVMFNNKRYVDITEDVIDCGG